MLEEVPHITFLYVNIILMTFVKPFCITLGVINRFKTCLPTSSLFMFYSLAYPPLCLLPPPPGKKSETLSLFFCSRGVDVKGEEKGVFSPPPPRSGYSRLADSPLNIFFFHELGKKKHLPFKNPGYALGYTHL